MDITADEIITRVTNAPDNGTAFLVMQLVRSRRTLEEIADQLYIDYEGKRSDTIRKAIVKEARA